MGCSRISSGDSLMRTRKCSGSAQRPISRLSSSRYIGPPTWWCALSMATARWFSKSIWDGCGVTCRIDFENHRSEEHTSELQSRPHLVCRLLLEKKKNTTKPTQHKHLHQFY